jgi:long-chain acyl-CoA synthetase
MQNFNSPLEAFLHWEQKNPNASFLIQPINGSIIRYSFAEAGVEARKIAAAIKAYDLPKQSHIALLSKNCAHWIISDLAIMMSGHVSIPLYPTSSADSIQHVLEHSESKAIIIGKLDDFESQKSGIPDIHKISIGLYGQNEGQSWEEIITNQVPIIEFPVIKSEDIFTIIYTSGTTGHPKGAVHTVGNFVESTNVIRSVMELPQGARLFSYLPLAHAAERIGIGTHGLVVGAEFSFPESLTTFASDLEKCQPDIFFGVPRIWTKFQEKILEIIPQKKLNFLFNIPILGRIIKGKLKGKLGLSNAKFIISGAAPLSASVMRWYKKMGIEILQGYGMTEDCIISHFNLLENNKIGTVGKRLPNVKTKLSPEGEILIKNNCLFKEYYKDPETTASVFDEEGYFRTGDKGEYDHDGFLSITGRIKDQFKTDKGKYISPSSIELKLAKNPVIEQICVVGTGIPHPITLITLSEVGNAMTKESLVQSLSDTLVEVNPKLKKYERIEKIVIMREDWTVDNGLITPTLKVKRNSIEKIHQEYYNSWFKTKEKIIFE